MAAIISTVKNTNLVNSSEWENMGVNDLIAQKNILIDRYEFIVRQENGAPIAKQILDGINIVESIIIRKCK